MSYRILVFRARRLTLGPAGSPEPEHDGNEPMPTSEERMETLEKQVRRQRRWNIALGVVVVVGGLMAAKGIQEVPDVIQTR